MTLQETLKINQQMMRKQNVARQLKERKERTKKSILVVVITVLLFLVLIWLFQSFSSNQGVAISNCIKNGNNVDYCVKGVI